uniref:ABC2_membrane domain-containing protein n=1 Tax=Caenorhabditis tropicalis TaxID=1561998 RepID=A0A1I7UZ09_9PELO
MAASVVQIMRQLADSGRTLISIIHQPTADLYFQFDKIIFLSLGRTAFMGTPEQSIKGFHRRNPIASPNANEIDPKIVMGLFIGSLYWQQPLDRRGVQNTNSALYFLIAELTFSTMFGIMTFMEHELPLIAREYHDGLFYVLSYYVSRCLSYLPLFTIDGSLMILISYWMIGLNNTWQQVLKSVLIAVLVEQSATSCGLFLACLFESTSVAIAFAVPASGLFAILSGLYGNTNNFPVYIQWMQWTSWFSYGKSVPQHVEECISFVLHVEECGGPRALFVDGNEWQRPSGSGRFYRITYPPPPTHPQKENGEEIGIWNIERTPWNCSGANSDIQVICRRYNGQKYSSSFGFVRKIYLLKILPSCPPEIANQLVNKDLAVVSYSYRNSTVPTFIEHPIGNGKLPNGEMVGEEVEVVNGELMMIEEEPEMRELVERVEMKRKTNGQRLMDILSRIHRFDEIRKKAHWQVDTTEIDELVQFGAILENSINHH